MAFLIPWSIRDLDLKIAVFLLNSLFDNAEVGKKRIKGKWGRKRQPTNRVQNSAWLITKPNSTAIEWGRCHFGGCGWDRKKHYSMTLIWAFLWRPEARGSNLTKQNHSAPVSSTFQRTKVLFNPSQWPNCYPAALVNLKISSEINCTSEIII